MVLNHKRQAGLACHSSLQGLEFLSVLEEWGNHETWERKEAFPLFAWAQSVKEEPFLLLVCVCLSCTETSLLISWVSSAAAKGRPVGEGCLLKGIRVPGRTLPPAVPGPSEIWRLWDFSPFSFLGTLDPLCLFMSFYIHPFHISWVCCIGFPDTGTSSSRGSCQLYCDASQTVLPLPASSPSAASLPAPPLPCTHRMPFSMPVAS